MTSYTNATRTRTSYDNLKLTNLSHRPVETVGGETERHALQGKGILSLATTSPACLLQYTQTIGRQESLSASVMEGLTSPPFWHVPETYLGLLHEPKGQS